jgi:site-specific DNA recombinase
MKQAIIYARFSPRPNPDQCTSIEIQEARCRAYCEAKGYDVIASYRDVAISGKNTEGRPGFQEALIHTTKIQGVLVAYDLTRLTRSILDAIKTADILKKHGAHLALVTQNMDTTTPIGRYIYHIFAALAQLGREETSERTRITMAFKWEKRERISSNPRYGFKVNPRNPKKVIVDPQEQETIRMILDWDRRGVTQKEMKKRLEEGGYRVRGNAWHLTTIRRILLRYRKK